jgi:hypothetical protein
MQQSDSPLQRPFFAVHRQFWAFPWGAESQRIGQQLHRRVDQPQDEKMHATVIPILFLALAQIHPTPAGNSLALSAPLDVGFRQMYNLQFDDAHRTLQAYEQSHPEDAMGPTAHAAAYLFSEFERLGILQTALFVNDQVFEGRQKPEPNPSVRAAFTQEIAKSNQRADAALAKSPNDRDALLAKVMNLGLESDYLAMVEKRNLAAVSTSKKSSELAEKLLRTAPDCYDAYLAVGIENYVLGLKPAPVRWLLRLYGARTDKDEGVRKLELTAEKGHYLLPYARLMLAVAALRDNDRNRARELLGNLAQEFPNNTLYRTELAKLQ